MAEEQRRKKKSNVVVWAILGLLILAMGGFGATGFGSSLSTVASVGDRDISIQDYADALRAEQNRLSQQTGQAITTQQMQMLGLDRQVMERLLATAALEEEAARIGLSVGDAEVARNIRETPAFAGVDGQFDRENYSFVLSRNDLTEREYEEQVREEIARSMLQAAIIGGTQAPEVYVDTLTRFVAETRDITLTVVTPSDLPGGALAPSDADLRAFYEADPEQFASPELRAITYAWITPDILVREIEIDDAQLRQIYDDRIDDYRQPARVLAERLAFNDTAAAEAARAAIDAGETTFDALVEERGLTLDDVDQGEIAAADLPSEAAEVLFALEQPGLAGPVETSLGPALYRVNAILDATEVPFEEVRDDLAAEVGYDRATRQIDAGRENVDDLLAGGATLEEVAQETDLVLGTLRWDARGSDATDIAAYEEFRAAARAATTEDFPQVEALSDGGLFALRLDEIIPSAVPDFDTVRAEVEQAWRVDNMTRRLTERAEALAADPQAERLGTPESLTDVARDATLEGTPPALLPRVFEAQPGETFAVAGDDRRAYIVEVNAVNVPDLTGGVPAQIRASIENQAGQGIAGDLFENYGQAIQAAAGFTVNQQAVEAVQSQLGGGVAPR